MSYDESRVDRLRGLNFSVSTPNSWILHVTSVRLLFRFIFSALTPNYLPWCKNASFFFTEQIHVRWTATAVWVSTRVTYLSSRTFCCWSPGCEFRASDSSLVNFLDQRHTNDNGATANSNPWGRPTKSKYGSKKVDPEHP